MALSCRCMEALLARVTAKPHEDPFWGDEEQTAGSAISWTAIACLCCLVGESDVAKGPPGSTPLGLLKADHELKQPL